jgi:hypothetical protein
VNAEAGSVLEAVPVAVRKQRREGERVSEEIVNTRVEGGIEHTGRSSGTVRITPCEKTCPIAGRAFFLGW